MGVGAIVVVIGISMLILSRRGKSGRSPSLPSERDGTTSFQNPLYDEKSDPIQAASENVDSMYDDMEHDVDENMYDDYENEQMIDDVSGYLEVNNDDSAYDIDHEEENVDADDMYDDM